MICKNAIPSIVNDFRGKLNLKIYFFSQVLGKCITEQELAMTLLVMSKTKFKAAEVTSNMQ